MLKTENGWCVTTLRAPNDFNYSNSVSWRGERVSSIIWMDEYLRLLWLLSVSVLRTCLQVYNVSKETRCLSWHKVTVPSMTLKKTSYGILDAHFCFKRVQQKVQNLSFHQMPVSWTVLRVEISFERWKVHCVEDVQTILDPPFTLLELNVFPAVQWTYCTTYFYNTCLLLWCFYWLSSSGQTLLLHQWPLMFSFAIAQCCIRDLLFGLTSKGTVLSPTFLKRP